LAVSAILALAACGRESVDSRAGGWAGSLRDEGCEPLLNVGEQVGVQLDLRSVIVLLSQIKALRSSVFTSGVYRDL
jgi:hypothetical protein